MPRRKATPRRRSQSTPFREVGTCTNAMRSSPASIPVNHAKPEPLGNPPHLARLIVCELRGESQELCSRDWTLLLILKIPQQLLAKSYSGREVEVDDASRVSRSGLEARQRQGARAGVDQIAR